MQILQNFMALVALGLLPNDKTLTERGRKEVHNMHREHFQLIFNEF